MVVGEVYTSSAFGHVAEVVEVLEYPFIKVKFPVTGNSKVLRRCNLKNLEFRDVDQPTVYGVGIVGDIKVRVEGKLLPSYVAWTSLLERCHKRGNINDQICQEWFKFKVFKAWHDLHVPAGWVVDKDYKVLGNTFYSPETCTPLPTELNSLLVKSLSAKGYTKTRNGKYDSRVRVEGNTVVRQVFEKEEDAYSFYVSEKLKYVKRLSEVYKDKVPSYVFTNACILLEGKL